MTFNRLILTSQWRACIVNHTLPQPPQSQARGVLESKISLSNVFQFTYRSVVSFFRKSFFVDGARALFPSGLWYGVEGMKALCAPLFGRPSVPALGRRGCSVGTLRPALGRTSTRPKSTTDYGLTGWLMCRSARTMRVMGGTTLNGEIVWSESRYRPKSNNETQHRPDLYFRSEHRRGGYGFFYEDLADWKPKAIPRKVKNKMNVLAARHLGRHIMFLQTAKFHNRLN